MSMYVKVPKEIKDYDEKLFLGLTTPQLIWGGIACATGIVEFIIFKYIISTQIVSWIIIFTVIPIFLIGWQKKDGMQFNKYMAIVLQFKRRKQLLLYDTEPKRKEVLFNEKQRKKAIKKLNKIKEDE